MTLLIRLSDKSHALDGWDIFILPVYSTTENNIHDI